MGAFLQLSREVSCQCPLALLAQHSGFDLYPGVAQNLVAAPGNPFIWIIDSNDNAGNAEVDKGVCAGRRSAKMGTGLKRHIGRCAPRRFARDFERLSFRMGTTANGSHGFGDDLTVLDDDAADGGIGIGEARMEARDLESTRHKLLIIGARRHNLSTGVRVTRNLGVDLRNDLFEIFSVTEVAIDGGVAYERHVIETLQRLKHLQADFFRWNFRLA